MSGTPETRPAISTSIAATTFGAKSITRPSKKERPPQSRGAGGAKTVKFFLRDQSRGTFDGVSVLSAAP
jgi:hypothetical protein